MSGGSRLKCFVPLSVGKFPHLDHKFFGCCVETAINKFLKDIVRGHVVGMRKVNVIKPVISQYVYYQFIGREIMQAIKFVYYVMNCFNQSRLAPIVFNDTIPEMPHR